jgi:hypothetical protein
VAATDGAVVVGVGEGVPDPDPDPDPDPGAVGVDVGAATPVAAGEVEALAGDEAVAEPAPLRDGAGLVRSVVADPATAGGPCRVAPVCGVAGSADSAALGA